MSDLSARLDLPLIKPSQAQKHVTHNEALQILDGLVQAVIEEAGAETPPFEPVEGQLFALGPSPTGDWAGEGGKLARRVAGAWLFLTPREGWRVWDRAAGRIRVHDGVAWVDPAMDLDNLDGVGIGTTFDATNRLAVASPATLLNNAGAGHQLKINKSAAADTASLLFQTGWSGRAEMGTAGNDDWSIKISPDGSTWTEALIIDKDTGLARGAAVQSSPADTTAGRIMTVGAGGWLEIGAAPLLPDLAATDKASGIYRTDSTTLNIADRPGGSAFGYLLVMRHGPDDFLEVFNDVLRSRQWHRIYRLAQGGFGSWFEVYDQSNIVGTVSQTGGVPTGAIFDGGSGPNGQYVRFANGTQIATNGNAAITTAPAAFAGTITKIDGDKMWFGRWY